MNMKICGHVLWKRFSLIVTRLFVLFVCFPWRRSLEWGIAAAKNTRRLFAWLERFIFKFS